MDKECIKRSVSRGVGKIVHDLVQGEIWKGWEQVKKSQGTPEDCMSFVELRAEDLPTKIQHIIFVDTPWVFHMPTSVGANATLVIVSLGDEEILMLQEEAKQVFDKTGLDGSSSI